MPFPPSGGGGVLTFFIFLARALSGDFLGFVVLLAVIDLVLRMSALVDGKSVISEHAP